MQQPRTATLPVVGGPYCGGTFNVPLPLPLAWQVPVKIADLNLCRRGPISTKPVFRRATYVLDLRAMRYIYEHVAESQRTS